MTHTRRPLPLNPINDLISPKLSNRAYEHVIRVSCHLEMLERLLGLIRNVDITQIPAENFLRSMLEEVRTSHEHILSITADFSDEIEDAKHLFLGSASTPPTTSFDGTPLHTGAIYYDVATGRPMTWDGGEWVPLTSHSVGASGYGSFTGVDGVSRYVIGEYESIFLTKNGELLQPLVDYTLDSDGVIIPDAVAGDSFTFFGIRKGTTTDSAMMITQHILTTVGQDRITQAADGTDLIITSTNHVLYGSSPFGVLVQGVDYTVSGNGINLSRPSEEEELFSLVTMPRFTNSEAQVILQNYKDELQRLDSMLREEMVSEIANGYVPLAGKTYMLSGHAYIGETGSYVIPDLRGLVPAENRVHAWGNTLTQDAVNRMIERVGMVRITDMIRLSTDVVIPAPLVFEAGAGVIVPVGHTLTVRGAITGPKHRLFWVEGNLVLGHDGTTGKGEDARQVHAAWFGISPDSRASSAAQDIVPMLQRVASFFGNARESQVKLDVGNYAVKSPLTMTRGMGINGTDGQGQRRTVFKVFGDGYVPFSDGGNEACFMEHVQFETDTTGLNRTNPFVVFTGAGARVRSVNVGRSHRGIVVTGQNSIVEDIDGTYPSDLGAGSSIVEITNGTTTVSGVRAPSSGKGPEALVRIKPDASNTSAFNISNLMAQSKAIPVVIDAETANVTRVNIAGIVQNAFAENPPAILKIIAGDGYSVTSVSLNNVKMTSRVGNVILIDKVGAGTVRGITLNDVHAEGNTGAIVHVNKDPESVVENIYGSLILTSRPLSSGSGNLQVALGSGPTKEAIIGVGSELFRMQAEGSVFSLARSSDAGTTWRDSLRMAMRAGNYEVQLHDRLHVAAGASQETLDLFGGGGSVAAMRPNPDGTWNHPLGGLYAAYEPDMTAVAAWGSSSPERSASSYTAMCNAFGATFKNRTKGSGRIANNMVSIGQIRPVISSGILGAAALSTVTVPSISLVSVEGQQHTPGYLEVAGTQIRGQLVRGAGNTSLMFQRDTAGTAVTISSPATFYSDYEQDRSAVGIIWTGKNDVNAGMSAAAVAALRKEFTDYLSTFAPNYIVLGDFPNTGNSAARRDLLVELDNLSEAIYGSRFVRIMPSLLGTQIFSDLGLTATSADLTARSNGYVPPSLMGDSSHLSTAAYNWITNNLTRPAIRKHFPLVTLQHARG